MGRTGPKKRLMPTEKAVVIEHQQHAGWHAFRRGCATSRKHPSLQDVRKAGGWTDETTLMRWYQHATPIETRRATLYIVD